VHSRVEQQAVFVQFHQPRTRANVRVRVQICDIHKLIEPQMGAEGHRIQKGRNIEHPTINTEHSMRLCPPFLES
jgi:hypothetical protein